VEDGLWGDAGQQTAGALDANPAGILANEDRTVKPIVPVGHSVQDRLPDGCLVEGGDLLHEKAILVRLQVVALVHQLPKRIQGQQGPLPEFGSLLGRSRPGAGTILEDDLRLAQVVVQRLAGAQEDNRRVGEAALLKEFGVLQKVCRVLSQVLRVLAGGCPTLPEGLDGHGVQVGHGGAGAEARREIRSRLIEDLLELVGLHGGEFLALAAPVDFVEHEGEAQRMGGHVKDDDPPFRGLQGLHGDL